MNVINNLVLERDYQSPQISEFQFAAMAEGFASSQADEATIDRASYVDWGQL